MLYFQAKEAEYPDELQKKLSKLYAKQLELDELTKS